MVLTGGGGGEVAWETGLLIGLLENGVDLGAADRIVETSAGAVDTDHVGDMAAHVQIDDASDHDRMLRFGRLAIDADPFPEELWRANFAPFDGPFPANYACTAIDCETGSFTVWDASSNVPLDAAVASSCAAPGLFPAITIDGRRYDDGGICSATNAHLAQGYDQVLVLHMHIVLPDPGDGSKPTFAEDAYPAERKLLLESGSEVETIDPSDAVVAAIGVNLMDPASMPAVLDAGMAQGADQARHVLDFWT